ncbi:MAG: hypothetical protein WC852_06995 [Candidatus Nanoarchaeia archaeon]|jgi:hypothetical protein
MNKRGQVYILAAIVMSIIIYGMVTISNRVVQDSVASDFERIANNYATETAKLVNSVAGQGQEQMFEAFKKFTVQFASYAKAQSPRFELISVFDNNGKMYIGNFLKEKIIVTCNDGICDDVTPLAGCYQTIPAELSFEGMQVDVEVLMEDVAPCQTEMNYTTLAPLTPEYINISVGTVAYQFLLETEQPDVVVVSWETNAKQRKVFTKGNFMASSGSVMTLASYCAGKTRASSGLYCTDLGKPDCGYIQTEEECTFDNNDPTNCNENNCNAANCKWASDINPPACRDILE